MEASPAAYHLIRISEGLSLKPYQDLGGYWTVGFGHLIGELEAISEVTYEEAEALLHEDVLRAEAMVERLTYGCPVTQGQFDALVSFTFNLGCHALERSTLLKLFRAGDIPGAANQFPLWDHVDGLVIAGLAKRRWQERALFLSGIVT